MKIMYQNFEIVVGEDSFDLYHIRPPKQVHKNKSVSKKVKVCLGYFTKWENIRRNTCKYGFQV